MRGGFNGLVVRRRRAVEASQWRSRIGGVRRRAGRRGGLRWLIGERSRWSSRSAVEAEKSCGGDGAGYGGLRGGLRRWREQEGVVMVIRGGRRRSGGVKLRWSSSGAEVRERAGCCVFRLGENGIGEEEDELGMKGDNLGILSLIFSLYCLLHFNPFISPLFVLLPILLVFFYLPLAFLLCSTFFLFS